MGARRFRFPLLLPRLRRAAQHLRHVLPPPEHRPPAEEQGAERPHGDAEPVVQYLAQRAHEEAQHGPGGGEEGGRVVAYGTPEQIAANEESVTGKYL